MDLEGIGVFAYEHIEDSASYRRGAVPPRPAYAARFPQLASIAVVVPGSFAELDTIEPLAHRFAVSAMPGS